MVISVLLFVVLFIAGLVSIFFDFPTNKFTAWFKSFFTNTCSTTSNFATLSDPRVSMSPGEKSSSGQNKVELMKMVFATFDKNGDGYITKQELRESLTNLSLLVTEKEIEEMVAKVDANGDGRIDFDKFCKLYETMIVGHQEDHGAAAVDDQEGDEEGVLKDAFDVFDKDKDGLISVEELGLVLASLGLKEGKKIENCKAMISKVDRDGDGMVNFDEFRRMMKAGGKLITAF